MATMDTLVRAGAVAVLALVAVVLVRDRPRAFLSWATLALCAAIASHLVISSPEYVPAFPLDPILRGAALAAPVVFWAFTRAFFGDDGGPTRWHVGAAVALVAIGFGRPTAVAEALYYAGSVGIVGLALIQVRRELRDDLVEPRRQMRPLFAAVVGVEILIVLGVELWLGGAPAPRPLETIKSGGALLLALAFGAWLVVPRRDVLAATPKPEPPPAQPATRSDGDTAERDRLLAVVVGEQLYRQEALTIGALARTLDVPEYRVRRIINQQLGYRNFNGFLNDLRTAEACRLLADPAHDGVPIFNLALDLGYGSLGPFNRAFKAKTGQTPTEYRRRRRESSGSADQSLAES